MPIKDYSTTAASNNAVPPNGAPEGMAIADVNNVMRQIMADVRQLASSSTIAAASTTDIGSNDATFLTLTGAATTINALGTVAAGIYKYVEYNAAHTLTYNATSLVLAGGVTRVVAAGDISLFRSNGAGNWKEVSGTLSLATSLITISSMPNARAAELAALSAFMGGMLNDADAATGRVTLEVDQLAHWAWDSGRGRVPRFLAAGTHFNNIQTPGVYNFDATGSSDAPPGLNANWCYVDVYRHVQWVSGTNDYITQVVRTMNGAGSLPRIWTRTYTQGLTPAWSNWFSLLHHRTWADTGTTYPAGGTYTNTLDREIIVKVNATTAGTGDASLALTATIGGVVVGTIAADNNSNGGQHAAGQFTAPPYTSWRWDATDGLSSYNVHIYS